MARENLAFRECVSGAPRDVYPAEKRRFSRSKTIVDTKTASVNFNFTLEWKHDIGVVTLWYLHTDPSESADAP